MLSKLKVYRGTVHIYYHNISTCRISTGIKAMDRQFDNIGLVKKGIKGENVENLNHALLLKKQEVDAIILNWLNSGQKPTGKQVSASYTLSNQTNDEPLESLVVSFESYLTYLSSTKLTDGTLIRIRSLLNGILDFQDHLRREILLEDVNHLWLERFEHFLSVKRNIGSRTKGYLNDNTIKKRFKDLKQFWRYLVKNQIIGDNADLENYSIKEHINDATALTKEELVLLKKSAIKTEEEQRALDLFLFCCSTGLRFSDAITLKRSNVNKGVLRKTSQKGKQKIEVLLNEMAVSLLAKYNFNLDIISNQRLNVCIKIIAKRIPEFHRVVYFEVPRMGKLEFKEAPLWTRISSHTARRTFIDLLTESNLSAQKIMSMTGHRSLETMNRYLQKRDKVKKGDLEAITF